MSRPPKTVVVESSETIYSSTSPATSPPHEYENPRSVNMAQRQQENKEEKEDEDTRLRTRSSKQSDGIEWFADVGTEHPINERNTVVLNKDVSRGYDEYGGTYAIATREGTGKGDQNDDGDESLRGRDENLLEKAPLIVNNKNNKNINIKGGEGNKDVNRSDGGEEESAFIDKSFIESALLCCASPAHFASEWTKEMKDTFVFSYNRARNLTLKEIAFFLTFLFILTSTQLCSVFGFNFWLHNFAKGSATYVSIVVPSVIYAIVNLLLIPVFKYRQKPGESLLFWTDSKESVLMLVAIGLADSVTGMTATYAVPHIPVIVQTSVSSCGAIFVYILHRFLYKKTALPFSFLLMVCFLFLIVSVVLSVAPLYLDGRTDTYIEGRWVGVYMFVIVAPAIYNVVQGRFLGKYAGREDVPPTTSKFVVLTGDYWVQALVSFAYFPLDFTPGFGPSPDAEHAWGKAKDALACIRDCEYNWIYLTLYVFGFWSGRVLRTIMNMYSPTMGQFVMQLMGPIKAFAIVLFPALNLKGNKSQNPAYNAGTFGALIVATLFYLLANEQQRMKMERRKVREAAEEEEKRAQNERGLAFLSGDGSHGGANGKGIDDYAKGYDDKNHSAYFVGAQKVSASPKF